VFKRLFAVIQTALAGKPERPQTPAADRVEPMWVEEEGDLASSSPGGGDRSPPREQIAIHAYHRWVTRGKPIGTDWEDWFEAERQLAPMTWR
jgi:hypothetical protein